MADAKKPRVERFSDPRFGVQPRSRPDPAASKFTLPASGKAGVSVRPVHAVFATDGSGRMVPSFDPEFYPALVEHIRRTGDESYVDWHDIDIKRVRAAFKQSNGSDDNELPMAVPD